MDVPNAGGNVFAKSKVKQNADRLALLEDRIEFSSVQNFVLSDGDIIVSANERFLFSANFNKTHSLNYDTIGIWKSSTSF